MSALGGGPQSELHVPSTLNRIDAVRCSVAKAEPFIKFLRRPHQGQGVEKNALTVFAFGPVDDTLGEESAEAEAEIRLADVEPLHLAVFIGPAVYRHTSSRSPVHAKQKKGAATSVFAGQRCELILEALEAKVDADSGRVFSKEDPNLVEVGTARNLYSLDHRLQGMSSSRFLNPGIELAPNPIHRARRRLL